MIKATRTTFVALVSASTCLMWAAVSLLAQGRGAAPADLAAALTFHASFDTTADADFALGDKRLFTATTYRAMDTAQPGLKNPDASIAAGKGRHGGALQFNAKNTMATYYQAEKNVAIRPADWSGTVSFWLSLDPEVDLTGFADPIQVTDKDYNNAALWVDFTNDKPRHFRLGVFPNLTAWNPDRVSGQTHPAWLRHVVVVDPTPFARGKWTHVAFTFAGLNGQVGRASLYLDGKLQGTASSVPETFTIDSAKATVRVGVNYAGLYDDLSIFNRALSDAEIQTLHALPAGVASLHR